MNPFLARAIGVSPEEAGALTAPPPLQPHARPIVNVALLDPFIGKWRLKGRNGPAAPLGPESEVTGEVIYDHLPGGYFVVGRWSRHFKEGNHIGLGVYGPDNGGEGFAAHFYDNLGFERRYVLVRDGRRWVFTGERERAEIDFSIDGNHFTEKWETSPDGVEWALLWELKGIREK